MNTDKNTALYEKMAAEQDKFRDWLKSQPPEEILKHTYEYTVREDILMAMEELDLPQSQHRLQGGHRGGHFGTLPGQPAGQGRGTPGDRAVRLHPHPLCAGKYRAAERVG